MEKNNLTENEIDSVMTSNAWGVRVDWDPENKQERLVSLLGEDVRNWTEEQVDAKIREIESSVEARNELPD